ncbi:unnamed protein product [Durusdinium trenchii]|uniref:Uncharacterized protein n=1 Tax=Durusdinium trenchii TaxID=1381693 RepID=A0ABP0K8T6_9DINO
MDAPSLRRAQTAAGSSAQAALPALMRSWSAPRRRHELGPTLCLEVPWKSRPRSLPCPHALEGFVEVVALDGRRSQEEVMRAQFLCHRSKFASQLVGFSRSPPGCQESTVFFYTKPDHLLLEKLGLLSHLQRLAVAHGAATALWTLHSLGASFGRLEVESLGLRAGRLQLVGVGLLQCQEKVSKDLEDLASLLLCMLGFPMREDQSGSMASGELWKRLLMASKKGDITERDQALQQRDNDWPENEAKLLGNLALRLLQVAQEADVERVAENALQNVVTDLATLLRSHHPPEGLDSRRFSPNTRAPRGHGWKVLRHVLRACWAFQQGLEAFCCVCLEVAPKSLGLLCPQLHGRYQLLCGDCLEPYVCSLIGTAELRRHEGGVVCPACACNCEEPTIFSRQQVQARLAGAALRRFVEATEEVEVAPEDPEEDEEWSVLVEDLNTRSVRLATHSRVSEDDEPKVLRRTKDVLPFTWLLCEGDSTYIQYEPDRMKLRQHMSPRLFHLQVAECLTMHCPRCHCPLDPDPDGCVAMTCLACNEGFCWVCFTACGDDAHEHAMDAHGSYFPGQDFVQAWHRKLRWQRVQQILQQLREDSQDESLKGCQALLADVDLWRFPREAPEVPEAVPGDVEEHAGPWGPVGLHLAARLGRLDAVGEALQREDVNLQDNRGMTPLCYACHEGRMEESLAAHEPDVGVSLCMLKTITDHRTD